MNILVLAIGLVIMMTITCYCAWNWGYWTGYDDALEDK